MHFVPAENDSPLSEDHKKEMRERVNEKSPIWLNTFGISKNPVHGQY
jgi:hypothetical protein